MIGSVFKKKAPEQAVQRSLGEAEQLLLGYGRKNAPVGPDPTVASLGALRHGGNSFIDRLPSDTLPAIAAKLTRCDAQNLHAIACTRLSAPGQAAALQRAATTLGLVGCPKKSWEGHLQNLAKKAESGQKAADDVILAGLLLDRLPGPAISDHGSNRVVVLATAGCKPGSVIGADAPMTDDVEVMGRAINLNAGLLQFSGPRVRHHRGIVMRAVARNGLVLAFAGAALRDDKAIVLTAVGNAYEALKSASPRLKNDPDVVRAAVALSSHALAFASEAQRDDPATVLAAIRQGGRRPKYNPDSSVELQKVSSLLYRVGSALQYASARLQRDEAVVTAAVSENGLDLKSAAAPLRRNKRVAMLAVAQNGLALQHADAALQCDDEVVLCAVRQHGRALQFAGPALQGNIDVVSAALEQDGAALQFASRELRAHPRMVNLALNNPSSRDVYKHVGPGFHNDKNLTMRAVTQDGCALQYASDALRADVSVVMAAVAQNGIALQYAHEKLRDDDAMVLKAVQQDGWALTCASARLQDNRDIALQAIRNYPGVLIVMDERWQNDRELVLEAVKRRGLLLSYASSALRDDQEVIFTAARQNRLAIWLANNPYAFASEFKKTFHVSLAEVNRIDDDYVLTYLSFD